MHLQFITQPLSIHLKIDLITDVYIVSSSLHFLPKEKSNILEQSPSIYWEDAGDSC